MALNKYVERRIIPVLRKKKPVNCTYDKEDKPHFDPEFLNSSSMPKCRSPPLNLWHNLHIFISYLLSWGVSYFALLTATSASQGDTVRGN